MWPFRRKTAVPCCPEGVRVIRALAVVDEALVAQSDLFDDDRNAELIDVALEVHDILTPARAKRRSR